MKKNQTVLEDTDLTVPRNYEPEGSQSYEPKGSQDYGPEHFRSS